MSNKISYVFEQQIVPAGQKATDKKFVSDDLRIGMDSALKEADSAVPGLGKSIGGALRAVVEGGVEATLKVGIPHSVSGKAATGTGTLKVTALPKI